MRKYSICFEVEILKILHGGAQETKVHMELTAMLLTAIGSCQPIVYAPNIPEQMKFKIH
jgi:hypothetical protein